MPESQNTEYKQSWRDEYLKWICGFANANGGTLLIGKDDNGHVTGLADATKLLEDIPNKVRDVLGILVDVNLHHINGLDMIEIVVEAYPYPVNYKGQYHYRSGSTKQELKGVALDKFLLQKKGKLWDSVPIPNVSTDDLSNDAFDFFRKKAIKSQRIEEEVLTDSNDHLLENLQLKEHDFLKRAAILLFHPKPQNFVTGAYIKIGFFETDDDLRFQDEVHGHLFQQIEKTMDLLFTKYIKFMISYEGISRVETPQYPKEAIREALLNALAHKDYSGGVPIQISVYADKLMIWNEGQLPNNWTVKNLLEKHPSRPYNPDIANAFFRSGYIESWGRGTLKIINTCRNAGNPDPLFKYDASDIMIEFPQAIAPKPIELNARQNKAILFLQEKDKITNGEYQTLNDCSRNTASNDLNELVNLNILKPSGQKGIGAYYILI